MIGVPKNVGSFTTFPKGIWNTTLRKVADNSIGDQGAEDWGFNLRVTFDNMKPADAESKDVGARPYTGDIPVVVMGTSLVELEKSGQQINWDDLDFRLRRGADLLSQLAAVFGVGQVDEAGITRFELGGFVQALREGQYDGRRVKLQVTHYTTKAAPDSPRDQIGAFGVADDQAAAL